MHLKVPTLGERMKAADPRTRVVSVAGKDRAAVMMGGHQVDELWWWDGKTYVSLRRPPRARRSSSAPATRWRRWSRGRRRRCRSPAGASRSTARSRVGAQLSARAASRAQAGDLRAFRASPASDAAVLAMAAGLIQDMKLGQGAADRPDRDRPVRDRLRRPRARHAGHRDVHPDGRARPLARRLLRRARPTGASITR